MTRPSGFDRGHICWTCGRDGNGCPESHDVQPCLVLDLRPKVDHETERIARARELEDRMLGEREAA